jgi:hypothetical protein
LGHEATGPGAALWATLQVSGRSSLRMGIGAGSPWLARQLGALPFRVTVSPMEPSKISTSGQPRLAQVGRPWGALARLFIPLESE